MSRPLALDRLPPRAVLAGLLVAIIGLLATLGRIGSDADWLAALGTAIARHHAIPSGLPFAVSPTAHWPNPLVLAELVFAGLRAAAGDRGLMLAQLLAATGALMLLARDARRGGAEPLGTAAALGLVAVGAAAALAIARVQLFSLLLFPGLVALLRADQRRPSGRIWLAVPLLAVWANLHGAVLLGYGVLVAYLVLQRGRRHAAGSLAVGVAGLIALGMTPALWHTATYDLGLLTNVAAEQGQGLWGPLSLTNPLDVLLVLSALILAVKAARAGLAPWEAGLGLALALLTLRADRNGVWLLFLLAPPAARRLHPARSLRALALPAGALGVGLVALALVRGPAPVPGASLVARGVALAHGAPVLADGSLDEAVAVAGGRIWAGNPIDAFSRPVQRAYLSWLAGQPAGESAVGHADVVLVTRGTPEQRLMTRTPGFVVAQATPTALLFARTGARRS